MIFVFIVSILLISVSNVKETLASCSTKFGFTANETLFECQDNLVNVENKPVNVLVKLSINRSLLEYKTPVSERIFN